MSDKDHSVPGDGFDPEELQRMMREMLGGQGALDPEMLAKLTGVSGSSGAFAQLFQTMQSAMNSPDAGIDWSVSRSAALSTASGLETAGPEQVAEMERAIQSAFSLAPLWLDEVSDMGASASAPKTMTRTEWTQHSIDTWVEMAEPVALSISQALTDALEEQLPEEMKQMLAGADNMISKVTGALFATQLGAVVGKLSGEVLGGGDIGIPMLGDSVNAGGVLLPQNLAQFADGLEQSATDVALFMAVRELAAARLFRHAKWLGPHVIHAITDYARGIHIDSDHILSVSHEVDPTQPEQIEELLKNGQLIPPKSPEQEAALERLETILALIEGWVDQITERATARLPQANAIAEMVRRSRATGGAAERAFQTLVGLQMRPRKLREASRMWQLVAERGSDAARDRLWEHPDVLPSAEEIEHPAKLLERLGLAGAEPESTEDDFDRELFKLLDEEQEGNEEGPDQA